MALSADRMTRSRSTGRTFSAKVASNAVIYQGGLVTVNSTGYAKAAATTSGERVIGVCLSKVDNSGGGADGALKVQVQTGLFKFANDGTYPVAQADVGRIVYVKDDQTVQTSLGGTGVIAGRMEELDADGGVWVYVDDVIGGFDAKSVDIMADNNTTAGILIAHEFVIADAASADYDIVVKEKFEVCDVIVRKQGAGAANTVTIKNGSNAITDAIAAAVDKTITRAGTIDPTYEVVAAGGTLRASVSRAAGSGAMKVTVLGRKVA